MKIYYYLQPNEGEIADTVVALLKKASLRSHVHNYRNTITVAASSANLDGFFPNKWALQEDVCVRKKFFEDNGLLSCLENRVAFCAGLLDGDGSCKPRLAKPYPAKKNRNLSRVGAFKAVWSFYQIKYPFLIDYFHEFVESLATDSSGFAYRKGMLDKVYFRKRGMEALLKAGIAKWSWKARKCAESIPKMLEERMRVRESERTERAERIRKVGMRLVDAAEKLRVRPRVLHKLYARGSLRATLVGEGSGLGYLVIPWEEVERLKEKVEGRRRRGFEYSYEPREEAKRNGKA
jgi:hypothetical protein